MTGRPPKPNAVKKLTGSRHVNTTEPKAPTGRPKCPKHLSDAARKQWRILVPVLAKMKVLTLADADALALYCTALARWIDAEKHLEEDGVVVKSPNGYPIQNPFLAVSNKAHEQIERLGARFGLNPSDRARLHVVPEKEVDELDKFMNYTGAA